MKKFFIKIKNWFIKHKEKLKKAFILFYVFLFGMGVGGCVESCIVNMRTASAQTVTGGQFVSNGVIRFNLGNIAQVRTVAGSPTVRYVSSALPTYLLIDCADSYDYVNFTVGIGSTDRSITTVAYNNLFSNYSFSFNNVSGASNNLNWTQTSTIISIADNTYNLDFMHLIQYRGSLPYTDVPQFGYFYPDNVYYSTDGNYGLWYGDKPTDGVTYFIMGCVDTNANPTRVIKYNVQTVFLNDSITFGTGNGLLDRNFILHTFLCDNGGLYYYGYNTYNRVISTGSTYEFNYTYDFADGDYYAGWDEGYDFGYDEGKTEGFYEGQSTKNEEVYQSGFDYGYTKGTQVALKDVNPFDAVLLFVDSFLNVKLFNTISLGTILSLVFGLVMVGIVIKMFLGG